MSQNWIPVVVIVGWALITLFRMHIAGRAREQAHRERLAMIERGLVPPPEGDPAQFERMMDWHPSRSFNRAADSRRTGIILIGVGVGLAAMFSIMGTGKPVGVGALLVLMGVAFLVNAMFEARAKPSQPQSPQEKQ
jgi:hypothetical protein